VNANPVRGRTLKLRLTDSQIFWVTIVLAIFPMRASSEDIPKIMLGEWVEPGTGCPGNIVELYRDEGKIRISGGSGDTFCTWTNGRVIARSSEQIIEFKPPTKGEAIVYVAKSQCQTVDVNLNPPMTLSAATYVRTKGSMNANAENEETLFIGSVNGTYGGLLRRPCKK
jgi:hypothetical protein